MSEGLDIYLSTWLKKRDWLDNIWNKMYPLKKGSRGKNETH